MKRMSILLELSGVTEFERPSLNIEEFQQEGDPAFYLDTERHYWSIAAFKSKRPSIEIIGKFETIVITHNDEEWTFTDARIQLDANNPGQVTTRRYDQPQLCRYIITFENVVREAK